jgi:hypothetical protein
MPVILSQHFSPADRVYLDAEGALYHYPRVYFGRVQPYDLFIYYRPLGESRPRPDSLTYFGHGVLGEPWDDPDDHSRRFVPIIRYAPFPVCVPLKDAHGNYYETGSLRAPQFQSAVREITAIAYHRILAAAGVAVTDVSHLPITEQVAKDGYVGRPIAFPRDALREVTMIPRGAGYTPCGNKVVDVYEAASLQERARADHQRTLRVLLEKATAAGGQCWYNNDIGPLCTVR